ncbi:MAG TPA: hypothetical protein VLM89_17490 [Phycisphaerae bacterium]|nr:hypothetical protein [Phycisphaerae bacterium]
MAWIVACLLAAAWPLAVGVVRPGITGYERALLPDMVHGRAHQPFVKRQLVPLAVRAILAITPESADRALRNVFERSSVVRRLRWPAADAPEFVAALAVMYASMVGFLLVLKKLLRTLLTIPETAARIVVLVVAVVLPITFAGKLYIYDFAQLLLFTAALLCMCERRWGWYYPLLALACLNKETSVLLIAVFVGWMGRRTLERGNLPHVVAQMAIGLSICGLLAFVYRDNPGATTEYHLHRNLAGPPTMLGQVRLALLAAGFLLAVRGTPRASAFMARGFLWSLLPLLIATFFLGYIDELRDYYEALPLGLCLVVLSIGGRWGVCARDDHPSHSNRPRPVRR